VTTLRSQFVAAAEHEDLSMDPVNDPAKLKAEATYNAAADHFDDGPLAFWDRYGRLTVERLSLAPGSSVLDVGCGSGASAIPAAINVGPHGQVIGIDLAERLLAIARSKSVAQNLHNVEFQRADMTALGYPDASFDAVISVFSIFFVTDIVAELRELWRVLRPGGKLAITTWGPRMFEPGSEAFWLAVKIPSRSRRNRQSLGTHHEARRPSPASVGERDRAR
jgi:ubiquinone/menaquinone biosynthesis C-methylase UbiE